MPPPVVIKPGVIFWPLPTEETPKPHPWIVISQPVNGKVLTVNITDECHCPDSPCVLEIAEHVCVTKRSVIHYILFKERDAQQMSRALTRGTGLNICDDVSPDMLRRVIYGMKKTAFVRDSIKIKYGIIPKPTSEPPF